MQPSRIPQVLAATWLFAVSAQTVSAQITVVDIIPRTWSDETHEDNEPNIAVNPANPLQIACSAFTLDTPTSSTMTGSRAPLFVSNDGGTTWSINKIIPSAPGRPLPTADITLRFGGRSGVLYAGILRIVDDNFTFPLNLLRTDNFLGPQPMTVLLMREDEDQPYIEAMTVTDGPDAGKDRVYVGDNHTSSSFSASAVIDMSLDAASAPPPAGFSIDPFGIELRNTVGQDGPQIRPAIHPSGVVYAAFYGWRSFSEPVYTADVVVVRDDKGGKGTTPFRDLTDSDGSPGRRVTAGISVPWMNSHNSDFGQERLGGDLAIAVDPNDSKRVFIAYCDGTGPSDYTMHIRTSFDSGVTWSEVPQTFLKAKNPGLAINSLGMVGLLYQQVTEGASVQRWVTHFLRTTDNFAHFNDAILADAEASRPIADPQFGCYLGDYDHVLAVGKDFYGIFSTSNESKFPSGIKFQRNVDPKTNHMRNLANTADVPASIDPFFFKVVESSALEAAQKEAGSPTPTPTPTP